jgi:hypothetical protein
MALGRWRGFCIYIYHNPKWKKTGAEFILSIGHTMEWSSTSFLKTALAVETHASDRTWTSVGARSPWYIDVLGFLLSSH